MAAISIEHRRELGRVEGELAVEREGHNSALDALANLQLNIPGGSETDDIERGLLFRIQALRGEMETRLTTRHDTTSSQDRALANLAVDVRAYLGESKTVEDIAQQWRDPAYDIGAHDAITTLGQLEGMVMGKPAPS